MSGGGGGVIIIRRKAQHTLSDPMIHGHLPATITGSLDPILEKDPSTWTHSEVRIVADAFHWAMCHLA